MIVNPIEMVDVYYNLHKKVWSCRSRRTGLVERHTRVVYTAFPATLVVRESGRQRVIAEQRKNVHAFARLDHADTSDNAAQWLSFAERLPEAVEVSYNPYRAGYFYARSTGLPVYGVTCLIMIASEGKPPRVWAVTEE